MLTKFFSILLLPTILCQYAIDTGMRPDVIFGDKNDRFDVSSIIKEQNRHFKENPEEYRRQSKEKHKGDNIIDALKNTIKSMRRFDEYSNNFAEHDDMASDGERIMDFESSLNRFRNKAHRRKLEKIVDRLHGGAGPKRRSGTGVDPQNEILLHYAMPIEMKVRGFLQVPLPE